MVRHRDDGSEDAGGVAVHADEDVHVAAALAGRERGVDGGADGGFGVRGGAAAAGGGESG